MNKLILLALVAVLPACVAPKMSQKATTIVESDESMVKKCKMLGVVEGFGKSGASTEFAITEAKNDAFEKAAERGATHVVYQNGSKEKHRLSGVTANYAYRAYKCAAK